MTFATRESLFGAIAELSSRLVKAEEDVAFWKAERDDLVARLTEIERKYRKQLWLTHGCPFPALYGDDGEMQCHACVFDFRRASLEDVEAIYFARRLHTGAVRGPDGTPDYSIAHALTSQEQKP